MDPAIIAILASLISSQSSSLLIDVLKALRPKAASSNDVEKVEEEVTTAKKEYLSQANQEDKELKAQRNRLLEELGNLQIRVKLFAPDQSRCHLESCVTRERKQVGRDGRQIRSVYVI